MIRLLLFLLLGGALAAYSFWIYLRAELPVGSGRRLAILRSLALLILLALLLDLHVPWGGPGAHRPRWALLDASLSMGAGTAPAWSGALQRARALAGEGWTIVRFGDAVRDTTSGDSGPDALRTALAPALSRAAEAGVSELRVLSDMRFDDPVEAASAMAGVPVTVEFEPFGGDVPNAGIANFAVADQLERGRPVSGEVELFGEGVGDSVRVEVREEGRLVLSRMAAVPAGGARARVPLELPAPEGEGRLRYTVRVQAPGDGFASDDEGVAYMSAGHEAGGLVVVSLRPDWEPRYLLEVLGEATGLRATGYLRVGPDRFAPMGRAFQRGVTEDSTRVGAAARDAALLVVHGLDAGTDAWGRSLTRRSGRVLLWPVDAGAAGTLGIASGPAREGEWYPVEETPVSPLAADLAGVRLEGLPPLGPVLPVTDRSPADVPLLLRFRGTGPGVPALVLDRAGGRRRVVALASGFWRWAARDGVGRDVYRRLWSGVAGWLLAADPATASAEVRPERWVVPRGSPVRWWVPGEQGDSVRLVIQDSADSVVVRDTVLPSGAGRSVGVLPPGTYRYVAPTTDGTLGEGRFDVEARTDEMLPERTTPRGPPAARAASLTEEPGGPLRTSPWPYLLILALLCGEWIGRRRVGLR